jgi:hypothetical protein
MQYMATSGSGVKPTTLPALRVIDAHSLPNRKASKAVRAVDGADILDGLLTLQNLTARLVAEAQGVSLTSLANARRLTPAQRDEVRRGQRSLVLPAKRVPLPSPAVVPASPPIPRTTMGIEKLLAAIVDKVGVEGVRDLLAAMMVAA